ncbi:MAG: VWA domain-containing protein [Phycisphaerales bacterium]|nr:VWA domain-containing protein [Phycisphaerales bacterium]
MNLIVDQPIWLWVMVIGVLAGTLGWVVLRGLPTLRRAVVVGGRFASFVCFALALAGLERVRTSDRVTLIAVVDTSGSIEGFADLGTTGSLTSGSGERITIDQAALSFLASGTAEQLDDDRLGIIAFDGRPSLVTHPRPVRSLQDLSFDFQRSDGTDIASALQRAQSMIAADSRGRIVLFSDGVSTRGNLDSVSITTPVDVVPIEYRVTQEVLVESVDVPARVTQESLMPVRVTLRSTGPANGYLRIVVDNQTINLDPDTPSGGLPLSLKGGVEPISLSVPIGSGRVHRVRAIWEPALDSVGDSVGDTNRLNNESTALTLTNDHGRVMVVSQDSAQEAQPLINTLTTAGWTVDPFLPAEVPDDVLGLEPYDLVIFVNTARDAVSQDIEPALDSYVRTLGGGVLFVGGYEALGAGGWNASLDEPLAQRGITTSASSARDSENTIIADLLPLNLEIPDDVVTTHAAVAIVLDSSGSMKRPVMGSSRSQQSVANNSAASAIGVLDPSDMVTVISFSGSPKLVVPITTIEDPDAITERIKAIPSGGGTNLAPALQLAGEQLLSVESKTKHIVVLSDGESRDPERLPPIANRLKAQGIKVSTITIGDEADEGTMRLIATESGGVYYRVVNPAVLPRIFLKAVRVLRRPMVREGVVQPVVVDPSSPMLIEGASMVIPELSGLVLTEFKTDDPRVMVPIVSGQGEPILAGHQVELGRVGVFTSDVSNWSQQWIGSESFEQFWTHLAQWSGRTQDPGIGELSISPSSSAGGGLVIDYTAIDDAGVPVDGLSVSTKVFTDGASQQVDLVQTGPGQYRAELDSVPSGDHVVVATPRQGTRAIRPTIGAVHIDDHSEFDTLESDRGALERLAASTGGRVFSLNQTADLFSREGLSEVSSFESMWRLMLILGFVLFLIDLGARRVAWDRWIAQARDETIAVSRTVRADQLENLAKRTKAPEPSVKIETQRVARRHPAPPVVSNTESIKQQDDAELEELSSLMAAKKRARERFDD